MIYLTLLDLAYFFHLYIVHNVLAVLYKKGYLPLYTFNLDEKYS